MDPVSARGLASVSLPQMNEMKGPGDKAGFQKAMQAQAQQPQPSEVAAVEQTQKPGAENRIDSFVKGISSDGKYLDKQMSRIERGADLSTAQLLQLQGVSYRYAQQVELASKMVEKVVGGFKQVLNTQV